MINVTAKPFRMSATGNSEKMNRGGGGGGATECMFCRALEIGLIGSRIAHALKERD